MASTTSHNRRSPVARFNTFEVNDDEIKAQIGHASHTQRALRQRPLWHPRPCHAGLQPGQLQRNSRSFDGATRPDSANLFVDTETHPLDRTVSFNSLSTLQRESEAARQSQWRDSPVSAYIPSHRNPSFAAEQKVELEDPCPPITLYTLKQARKDKRDERRSTKKKEKEQKKADKIAAHRRRASEAHIPPSVAADVQIAEVPKRAASDPSSFKASKEAAIQLVKRLTTTKSRLIRRRSKNEDTTLPPHIDDFSSKPRLQEYLNSSLPETTIDIAELPGSLPPYTPVRDVYQNTGHISYPEPVNASPVCRSRSNPQTGCSSLEASRMMRCDLCEFGIKLDEQYFHCSKCNDGDRITCSACDASGLSCRHELTERTRRVLRYDDGDRPRSMSRHNPRRRQTAPSASIPDDASRSTPVTEPQNTSATLANANHALREKHFQLELKELAMRKREQDITLRERESALKEREGNLRIREAEAEAQVRQQDANTRMVMSRIAEMASLGAQFVRSQSQKSTASSDEDVLADADADTSGVRQHATKRKTGAGRSGVSSAKPGNQLGKLYPRRALQRLEGNNEEEDDDDEEGAGTPKKAKVDVDATSGEVLYACHFCKFNSQRYSERNNLEKQYRGCSSGYWPDISRLKQHLYRVHWRGKHCKRCYKTFKSQENLDFHTREPTACTMRECPFPEKFGDEEYNEIKRKRPTTTAEDVWYIIYATLFTGHEPPSSPFADSTPTKTGPDPASSPPRSAQQDILAFPEIFEARLNQRQDILWLQQPGARQFLREQVADIVRSMAPLSVATHTAGPVSAERSPESASSSKGGARPSLHLQSSCGPSTDASPDPLSATSTHSTSSGQWLLPSHRHSFSRPLPVRSESMHEPTLISATDTTPSEVMFRVPTPVDVENDQYDSESHSWLEGDEALGLAITTAEDFDFNFEEQYVVETLKEVLVTQSQNSSKNEPRLMSTAAFQPVKVAGLAEHLSAEATVETCLKPNTSNASADSGYYSTSRRPSGPASYPQTRPRVKSQTAPPGTDFAMHDPSQDSGINLSALEVPYQDFLGADMDECGNINGRSLTDYLYPGAQ